MGGTPKTVEQTLETAGRNVNKTPAPVDLYDHVPEYPAAFTAQQKEDWNHICESLITMRSLTKQTLLSVELAVYAMTLARDVMKDKKARPTARLAVLNAARIAQESLGLTPTSHAKVKPAKIGPGSTVKSGDERGAIAARLLQ